MTIRFKVLMAAMTAVLALSFAVGTANALRSLSISGPTTLTLNGQLTFTSSAGSVECNATITKTVSRTIPKIDHILIGKITRVDVERTIPSRTCRASFSRLNNIEIPRLEREETARILKGVILGTLPRITGILFLVERFLASFETDFTGTCPYESPARGLPVLAPVEARGDIGRLRLEPNAAVRLEPHGLFCPATGELLGEMTPLQTTNVRLI
jgi:hypothetical protein